MPVKHLFRSATDVLQSMNEAGAMHQPFFFILNYELSEGLFIPEPLLYPERLCGIAFRVGQHLSPCHFSTSNESPRLLGISPESQKVYAERFAIVQQGLQNGDSFLTNLTIRTPIQLSADLPAIYAHTKARYQVLVPEYFVCYSPETFIRITNNEISTFPMKGTISAEDEGADLHLLADYKEGCEHSTIVDLMRNDLNRVARYVAVRRFKYLDLLSTSQGKIWQMSSEIVGSLDDTWHSQIGTILRTILPAGSISGAPKERTCAIIRQAEGISRGYYTGICGYYDGQSLDSGVLIRYIEQEGQNFYYRSGGGITINSQMTDEYAECLQKIYLPTEL